MDLFYSPDPTQSKTSLVPPLANLPKSQYDKVIVTTFSNADSDDILKIILTSLKPNGKVVFLEHSSVDGADLVERLKLNGFQNPTKADHNGKYDAQDSLPEPTRQYLCNLFQESWRPSPTMRLGQQ